METVYFDYNSSDLTDGARATMANNADWLRRNDTVVITIEGHCDSRGSTEYNLALGEKRAKVTRSYLISLGVGARRLGIVSYGEEQPMDYAETTAAHGRNRRAEFRVVRR
jgi:peptidoglycan-associated lipoprotein